MWSRPRKRKRKKEEPVKREFISQLIRRFGIELEEENEKSLIDEILNKHHEELDTEKNLTLAEKERADQANTTITELQKSYDTAVKSSESLEALKGEITTLKSQNKQTIADIEAKYTAKLLDNAIELALTQAGAKNNKAAAALIDKTNLKLNDDGTVFGLSEIIDSVKSDETTSFLFDQPKTQEEKQVYNYIPKSDVVEKQADSIDTLFDSRNTSNSQIIGWE